MISDTTIKIGIELHALALTVDRFEGGGYPLQLLERFSRFTRTMTFLSDNLRNSYENPENPLAFRLNASRMW